MNDLRRSQRQAHPIKHFDEREAYLEPPRQKKGKEKPVEIIETRSAVEPPPQCLKQLLDNPRPRFSPPIRAQSISFQVLWKEREPMALFLKFLDYSSILSIVAATNVYAQSFMGPTQQHARDWDDLTPEEFLLWLGLLLYMGLHIEKCRRAYWSVSTHNLGRFMKRNRWEQIHRFWTIHDEPLTSEQPWFMKLEPLLSNIRSNCQQAVSPSFSIAIDEGMIRFRGRSKHKVKLPGKSIPEGYKLWMTAYQGGYIANWLMHLNDLGTERIEHKTRKFSQGEDLPQAMLAPT